eukprot:TRINITY_DN16286_c0_g2_i1.p1 TRINITY_DN16286_c0_g2~~TRINITY_DN16286_c0_g2_i1.p1  ORF type:complete len:173 (+),score=37.18 TRINITY_DN16286_c0_g2_i1:543-1061(+)
MTVPDVAEFISDAIRKILFPPPPSPPLTSLAPSKKDSDDDEGIPVLRLILILLSSLCGVCCICVVVVGLICYDNSLKVLSGGKKTASVMPDPDPVLPQVEQPKKADLIEKTYKGRLAQAVKVKDVPKIRDLLLGGSSWEVLAEASYEVIQAAERLVLEVADREKRSEKDHLD